MKRIAGVALLLVAAAALVGVTRIDSANAVDNAPTTDSVTVNGFGSVRAVPTRASLSLGVDSRGETAKAALSANAREMRRVIDAVRTAGGQEIGTQSVSLSQVLGEDGGITGYAAANVVGTVVGVDRAGAVIDAAVAAGANQVSGPSLLVADQAKLYGQALAAAVTDARQRAQVLATATGRTLGRATTIAEGGSPTPMPMFEKAAASDAGTPVEAGSQETTANVTVTFALT